MILIPKYYFFYEESESYDLIIFFMITNGKSSIQDFDRWIHHMAHQAWQKREETSEIL